MAGALLAAGRIAARPGIAPLCRNRVAGIRVGTRLLAVRRGIQTFLRYVAGDQALPRNGLALRRRDGYGQLLHDPVARQPRAGVVAAGAPHRRRRGTALQTFLPFFPAIPRDGMSEPRCNHSRAVAAVEDDRRRRQLYSLETCLSRSLSRGRLRCRGKSRLAPAMPRSRSRSLSARDERAHAAEAAGARSAHTASGIAGCGGAGAPPGAVKLT